MKTPLLLLPAQGPAPAFSDPDVLCPQPPPASGGPLCLRVHFHEPFHRIIATLLRGWNCHLQFTGEKVKLGDMEPLARHLDVRSGAPGPGKDVPDGTRASLFCGHSIPLSAVAWSQQKELGVCGPTDLAPIPAQPCCSGQMARPLALPLLTCPIGGGGAGRSQLLRLGTPLCKPQLPPHQLWDPGEAASPLWDPCPRPQSMFRNSSCPVDHCEDHTS